MIPAAALRRLALVLPLFASACSFGFGLPPRQAASTSVSAADRAVCRQRADEVYAKQNRGELVRADSYATTNRDSPFAVSGVPSNPSAGLSSRYAREQLLDECLASAPSNVGAVPGSGTATAAPPPAP